MSYNFLRCLPCTTAVAVSGGLLCFGFIVGWLIKTVPRWRLNFKQQQRKLVVCLRVVRHSARPLRLCAPFCRLPAEHRSALHTSEPAAMCTARQPIQKKRCQTPSFRLLQVFFLLNSCLTLNKKYYSFAQWSTVIK